MKSRRPKEASKRVRIPKTRAQRAKHAIVRSPKDIPAQSVAAGSTESPPGLQDSPRQEAHIFEHQATKLQGSHSRMMRDNEGFGLSLEAANLPTYQAKFLEMALGNMQFTFELAQRLAAIRSPFEIPAVVAELTKRRIDILWKYSKEIAELSTMRLMV